MATFFVGQRVRIRTEAEYYGSYGNPAGQQGRIVAQGRFFSTPWVVCEWELELDGGRLVICDSYELEPILPSGHRPAEYSYTELMDQLREGVSA